MKFPKIFKEKPKEILKDHFEAKKGEFLYSREIEVKKSFIFDIYTKFFEKKLQNTGSFNIPDAWETGFKELPEMQRNLLKNRVLKSLGFNDIIIQVEKDLPGFKVHSTEIISFKYKKIENTDNYLVVVNLSGVCSGNKQIE